MIKNRPMKRVAISKFSDNCYILVSCPKAKDEYSLSPTISFLYDGGEYAAEWEPKYGPIQVWQKADELKEGTKKHYFYDFVVDESLNWSQLAVDDEELKRKFLDGDYELIFASLGKVDKIDN